MAITAESIRKLAALRIAPDQMAGVLEILAEAAASDEERKRKQRARTAKSRARRNGNVTPESPEAWQQRWQDLQSSLLAKRL